MLSLVLLGTILATAVAYPQPKATECGYQSCNPTKTGMINVHLIPHSHDDVGWLKTVDQYLYGSRQDQQRAGVQYIIDSVVQELMKDPARRFIYVETGFFWPWWIEQDNTVKEQVKQLVAEGRLEFIGGAWSMQDEGATYYQSNIDQYTWGLRKLNDTFGKCGVPRIGWMIDPFGHSRETASLFAAIGFDAFFVNRIDYQDKTHRLDTKTLEFVWEGSDTLEGSSDIFTSTLFNHYSHPGGFCFDDLCGDDPIIDNTKSVEYNADKKSDDFINYVKNQAYFYNSDHILVPMGDDFNYMNANQNYKNMDKLIRAVNARQDSGSNVNVIYSTPSCYIKSVNEANLTFSIKTDDFFPYGTGPHNYLTGYFSSRPALKYYERLGNNFLQVSKQLSVLATLQPGPDTDLDNLCEAMGVLQHHDAVSGTERQHVANDYARRLSVGFEEAAQTVNSAMKKLTALDETTPNLEFEQCFFLNISQCDVTTLDGENNFIITIYNPLSWNVTHHVRVPIYPGSFTVNGPDGEKVPSEVTLIPDSLVNIPGRTTTVEGELLFNAVDIPSLGFKSYYVQRTDSNVPPMKRNIVKEPSVDSITIGDENISITISETTGRLAAISSMGINVSVDQNFWYYVGAVDNVQNSDAYCLRPAGNEAVTFTDSFIQHEYYHGDIVEEVRQTFVGGISQVIRHYKGEQFAEIEFLVGPVPIDDNKGKEVLSRFTTDLKTDTYFYDDSNGRQSIKRSRIPAEWAPEREEPVAANYYPATNWAYISDVDDGRRLVVVTDRSQGCSSLHDSELELLVHRRLLDPNGLVDGLNEQAYGDGLVIRGKHWILAGNVDDNAIRRLSQQKVLSAWTFVSRAGDIDVNIWHDKFITQSAGAINTPPEVNILTLEPWKDSSVILRVENIQISGHDVTVDLETLLTNFEVESIRETNLAANQWIEDVKRLFWNKEVNQRTSFIPTREENDFEISLKPQEIRTFILEIKPKQITKKT